MPQTSYCASDDCTRAIAPADGEFCSMHSKKLATPASAKAQLEALAMPLSSAVARKGIKTSTDFANFMGALMADVVEGRVDPAVANSACKAGDALLKVVEMKLRHGVKDVALQLTDGDKKA